MVEQHVQFALNGIVIDGTMDIVDEWGVIRDHKFVSKTPTTGALYVLNMTGRMDAAWCRNDPNEHTAGRHSLPRPAPTRITSGDIP